MSKWEGYIAYALPVIPAPLRQDKLQQGIYFWIGKRSVLLLVLVTSTY